MDLGLKGRVAAVAASSAGLGRAIAQGLASEGVRVAMCSRDETRIHRAAEEIAQQTGSDTLGVAADLAREDDAHGFVRQAAEHWGRLDILVTNAGGPPPGTFDDLNDDQWQQAFKLNLMSNVRMIREALPYMRTNRWGRIITIVSNSVKTPIPNLILSNAMRVATVGMTKTLSEEIAAEGITVNNICPGRIDTDRVRALDEDTARRTGKSIEEVRQEMARQIPMGRYGEPEELANLAVFVASERASYVTGTTMLVDGGLVRNLM